MLTFVKDLLAIVALGGFSAASLRLGGYRRPTRVTACGLAGAAIGRAGAPQLK